MKKVHTLTVLASLLLAAFVGAPAFGATLIIGDSYNIANSGSGFNLGSGVNSGINPPTTRLTGSAAAGLRYIKAYGVKVDSAHKISGNKMSIDRIASDSSTLTLSSGSGAYDFGTALGSLAASTNEPAVYEFTINIANAAAGSQRCAFAVSSTAGTANAWDFAIQLVHANTSDSFYTLYKRFGTAASGTALPVNLPIGSVGTYSNEVAFLIRITDAGAQTDAWNSRVQVSIDGGSSWIYDTSTDTTDLPNGWRFPTASRFVYFDVAGGAGPVTFDNLTLNWISGPTVSSRIWTGGATDSNWSSAANWGGSVPGIGDTLIFNGTSRQANNNNLTGLITPCLAFNNGGFTLSGNTFTNSAAVSNYAGVNTLEAEMAWTSAAVKTWSIASGSELVLNNVNTVEVNGDHSLVGGGTLKVKRNLTIGASTTANPAFIIKDGTVIIDGGTFSSKGGYRIGSSATPSAAPQTILTNGAHLDLTALGGNLRAGDVSNAFVNRLVINNSSLTMAGGILALPTAAGCTGEVSQVGGIVSGCRLYFSDAGAGNGSYTVQNGVLEAWQIKETTNGYSSIAFDNAVLRIPYGASNAFMAGLNLAEIRSGGLGIDAIGDVLISQSLTGTGSLVKSNYGAVTLTGANSYSGNTSVREGKLVLATGRTYNTPVEVADGAELGVLVQSAGKSLTNQSVSLGTGGSTTLSFDLGTFGNPTAPLMRVGTLSPNGSVTINIANGLALSTGPIVLVDYDTLVGGGFPAFVKGTLPSGVTATLVHDVENTSINLVLTGVPGYRWSGAVNSDWDNQTENWINQQTGSSSIYWDGNVTEFMDDAVRGVVNVITIPTMPLVIVSNNTLPYVWNSTASYINTPLIRKYGAASLTRIGGEADSIAEIELNAGSYIYSNVYNATLSTHLSDVGVGTGTFVKQGPGDMVISSTNNGYDGGFRIEQGLVKMGNDDALGSNKGGTTIANGATLDINDKSPGGEPVIVSGAGVDGKGAIIDSTTAGAVETSFRDVTLAGDTTLGAPNGGRWDIRARSSTGPGPGLRGNGYKLTKVGSGSVSIACQRNIGTNTPYWEMNLGDILISEGSLAFAESVSLGNPSASLTISPGAWMQLYDLGYTNPILRNITMTDARLTCGGGSSDTNVINGSIQITGANGIYADQAKLIINGAIVGSGSLTFSAKDPGTYVLNGINTYPGDTLVTNGMLAGTGVIAGNLVMYGGTNSPGWTNVGTFTVNGNVTLGGNTYMQLDRGLSVNSDRLVVGGALQFGGSLTVVLGPGAPAPRGGDVYKLFSKGGVGTFSSINLPNLSALPGNLGWDTSNLNVDGTIVVTGTSPVNPPNITSYSLVGTNIVFGGIGGVEGATYTVLSATDVAADGSAWTTVGTGAFATGGTFTWTNRIDPASPATFFKLRIP